MSLSLRVMVWENGLNFSADADVRLHRQDDEWSKGIAVGVSVNGTGRGARRGPDTGGTWRWGAGRAPLYQKTEVRSCALSAVLQQSHVVGHSEARSCDLEGRSALVLSSGLSLLSKLCIKVFVALRSRL